MSRWFKGYCLACEGTGWIECNWGSTRCSCNPYPVQEQLQQPLDLISNKTKMGFANTMAILDLGATAFSSMSECMRFGMVSGCAEDCPVFERGECELQEENRLEFLKQQNQDNKEG